MHSKITLPQFESGSFSERSQAFFNKSHQMQTHDSHDDMSKCKARTVTWAHYPYRYWLKQTGVEVSNIFRRKRIEHRLFQIALMSAARTSDGRREFDQWYITQPNIHGEQIAFLSNIVDTPEKEKSSGSMLNEIDFVLTNHLCTPNAEDLERLASILELGRLDGFEPVYEKPLQI